MISYPNIDPVLLHITENIGIRWYSLAYIVSAVLGASFVYHQNKKFNFFPSNIVWDYMINYGLLGVIIGARLFEVIVYEPLYYLVNPIEIFKVWHGGMSFHGGLIGFICGIYIMCKKYKIDFAHVADLCAVIAPSFILMGRLANFINAELYGRVSDCAICMLFPSDPLQMPRHPSQLYEALGEGVFLLAIMLYLLKFTNLIRFRYALGMVFVIGYSIIRFIIEFFRESAYNVELIVAEVSIGQFLCLIQLILALLFLFSQFKSKNDTSSSN